MAKVARVASLEAHRAVGRATHAERRRDQGEAAVARERLALEHELRVLEKTINDYEEVIARLPDDLGPADLAAIAANLGLAASPASRAHARCRSAASTSRCSRPPTGSAAACAPTRVTASCSTVGSRSR